jgi:hypothetical protein
MVDLHTSQIIGEYLGTVIVQEPSIITTILGGRVNIVELKEIDGQIKI